MRKFNFMTVANRKLTIRLSDAREPQNLSRPDEVEVKGLADRHPKYMNETPDPELERIIQLAIDLGKHEQKQADFERDMREFMEKLNA